MTEIGTSVGRVARSPGFKFFLICFLILLLLIPLLMVIALVSEREGRANSVQSDVARTWGGAQQISGPFIAVPYMVRVVTQDGEKRIEQMQERRAIFLPEDLSINGKAASSVLHRSIFDVNVFTANLTLEGRFLTPDMADVDPNAASVRWRDAVLVLAVSDVSGLKEAATVQLNGSETLSFAPSVGVPSAFTNGIHAKLGGAASVSAGDAPLKPFTFRADLVFTGSQVLTFAPAARETKVALSSDWPHPSFTGSFLPVERSVSDQGFTASWRVPHLARSVPHAWMLGSDAGLERFGQHQFGVTFYQPVDFYDYVSRAVKYGILFLAVGFMGVFVLELLSTKRVHAVQYLFVGLAMVFFYVLLLSLSEHTGFTIAYIVASAATGGMLSLYTGKVLESRISGLLILVLFAVLYGLLYLILTLEDYALLAGALLGFVALTAVMFATLRVDWSGLGARAVETEAPKAS
jgi:inner membrane protein